MKRIYLECKLLMKNRITKMLLVISVVLALFYFQNLPTYEKNQQSFYSSFATELKNISPNSPLVQALTAVEEGDWRTYYEITIPYQFPGIDSYEVYYESVKDTSAFKLEYQANQEFIKQYEILQKIKTAMGYEKNPDTPMDTLNHIYYYEVTLDSLLNYNLYKYNLAPTLVIHKNSLVSTIAYSRYYLPALILLFTIVLSNQSLQKEEREGTLRTNLLINSSRKGYLFYKLISCSLIAVLITFLPMLLIAGINSGVRILQELNYPLLSYENTFTSFNPIYWYSKGTQTTMITSSVNGYQYFKDIGVNTILLYGVRETGFHIGLGYTVIPYWLELIAMIFHSFLFSLFYVVSYLFATVFKRKWLGTIITIGILLGLYGISSIYFGGIVASFSPFAYLNVVKLIEGSVPYSYLSGIVCLIIWIILLKQAANFVFNRRDL